MRRVTAGLGSLVAAAGLATTFALSAGAAPQEGLRGQSARAVSDDLPSATELKRRELREVAIKKVLAGKLKVQQRGASEVAKVGRTTAAKGQPAEDQYVELAREKTDKIFVVLAEFGNQRDPRYPDQDTDPNTARADAGSTARCTTRSRSPIGRRTTRRSGRQTTTGSTTRTSTSARARARTR